MARTGRNFSEILDSFRAAKRPAPSKHRPPSTAARPSAPASGPGTGWSLAEERATYAAMKDELLAIHEGRYALIKASKLIGVYQTPGAAEGAAIDLFGDEPRLIKQILRHDPPVYLNNAF